ncbi:MAG: hypothetical protein FJ088_11625 [Deltaproteobacteria bacterium]|nr:hypothetical protein [Deltaproteobacteria bacterium]
MDVYRLAVEGYRPRHSLSVSEISIAFLEHTIWNRSAVELAAAPAGVKKTVETRPVYLDMRQRPILAERFLRAKTESPPSSALLDFGDGRICVMGKAEGFRVPFMDRPCLILACRKDEDIFIFIAPPPISTVLPKDILALMERQVIKLNPPLIPAYVPDSTVPLEVPESWLATATNAQGDQQVVTEIEIRVPASANRVMLIDFISSRPTRMYARSVGMDEDGPGVHGEPFIWHAN